jgi:hypothetical protein
MRRYRPYWPTRLNGAPGSWSAMSSHTSICISCPWSARPDGGRPRKRGGKSFSTSSSIVAYRGVCAFVVCQTPGAALVKARMNRDRNGLRGITPRRASCGGRRLVPAEWRGLCLQSGRERPPSWGGLGHPGRVPKGRSRPADRSRLFGQPGPAIGPATGPVIGCPRGAPAGPVRSPTVIATAAHIRPEKGRHVGHESPHAEQTTRQAPGGEIRMASGPSAGVCPVSSGPTPQRRGSRGADHRTSQVINQRSVELCAGE